MNSLRGIRAVMEKRAADAATWPGFPLVGLETAMNSIGLEPLPEFAFCSIAHESLDELEPGFKTLPSHGLSSLRAKLLLGDDNKCVAAWAEKLLRWFEIRRWQVWRIARQKWQTRYDTTVGLLELRSFFLEFFFYTDDLRFLNAALKFEDLHLPWQRTWHRFADDADARSRLAAWYFRTTILQQAAMLAVERNKPTILPPSEDIPLFAHKPISIQTAFAGKTPRIGVFSPNPYSQLTLVVTELLCRAGVSIQGLYVRRLLNWKRLVFEYRRDGSHLLNKIFKKLLFRGFESANTHCETLADIKSQFSIPYSHVNALAKARGFPVHRCWELNDADVLQRLRDDPVDLIVFTGGGLIRDALLENAGYGVLNAHPGVLPLFRGMDSPEWTLLEGYPEWVGYTVHFMAKGVDTGPYLARYRIDYADCSSYQEVAQKLQVPMAMSLVSNCLDFLQGKILPQPQREVDGKQYFYMHSCLHELVNQRLNKNSSADSR